MLYIDENLTWHAHVDHLCSLSSSKILLLQQLSEYVSTDTQKMFYQGHILPFLDYGSIIWGSTTGAHIERLLKLQKRAARIILKADVNTPSVGDMKDCNGIIFFSFWNIAVGPKKSFRFCFVEIKKVWKSDHMSIRRTVSIFIWFVTVVVIMLFLLYSTWIC